MSTHDEPSTNLAAVSSYAETRVDILNFDREELSSDLSKGLGLEPFRARQLISWIYRKGVTDFGSMTDIAKSVRKQLEKRYRISRPSTLSVEQSNDGTRKYLFGLDDGLQIEAVLIKQPTRFTLCISSQVGCAIGCGFCRTGKMGFTRNLRTAEMVGQVLAVRDDIRRLENSSKAEENPEEFQNIVFMGMGEPLHNLDNVVRAVNSLNDDLGLSISARKITVSTSGLVPAMKEFGERCGDANLALSLNATSDEVRTRLIPINRKWPIAVLIQTLREYPLKRRQRITIEYVLIKGVNDREDDLRRLPNLLRGIPVKINLIPYNANAELGYETPAEEVVLKWQETLLDAGLNSTIRWSKGVDINAACGQLATSLERTR